MPANSTWSPIIVEGVHPPIFASALWKSNLAWLVRDVTAGKPDYVEAQIARDDIFPPQSRNAGATICSPYRQPGIVGGLADGRGD